MSTHEIRDHYTDEFLESLYTKICLAHAFMSGAEKQMNTSDAPVDDLYEHVEQVYAEVDELYNVLCKVTDRVRVDGTSVKKKYATH